MTDDKQHDQSPPEEVRQRVESPPPGLLAEFWQFLKHNKKWWLVPLLLALLLLGLLVVLSGSGLTTFIYPLA